MRDWARIVMSDNFAEIAKAISEWRIEKGFETGWTNLGEKLMLVMTEVSEACDEAKNGSYLIEEIAYPSHRRVESQDEFHDTIMCYCEEWTDAFVRIMDVIGTLDLMRTLLPAFRDDIVGEIDEIFDTVNMDSQTFKDSDDHDWGTVFGPVSASISLFVLGQMSKAMEEYRDVELSPTLARPHPEKEDAAAYKLGQPMLRAAMACVIAVERAGEDWRQHLRSKMEKNEQRPPKHNRQR
jgi:hypothetical protein